MRVLHLVPAFFSFQKGVIGGAERFAVELARHMAKVVPTTLVAFGAEEEQFSLQELKVFILKADCYIRKNRFNPFSLSLIPHLLRADTIHCHQKKIMMSTFSLFIGHLIQKKVFVTDLGGGGWDVSSYFSIDKFFSGHLHISTYSKMISGHQQRQRAHVIYGGVDSEKFRPDERNNKSKRVLFVGRILPHKGIDYLIQALPDSMQLDIVGQSINLNYLQLLKDLAKNKDVNFVFDCQDEQLVSIYRKALCIVLPSVYTTCYGDRTLVPELLGQTLLEGMACGLPAVCTKVASMPEIVEDGINGFIVPPNDASALMAKLRFLSDHPDVVRTMGRNARQTVIEKFRWEKVVARCLDIYKAS